MRNLLPYYVSRLILATLFGVLFAWAGQPWWLAALLAIAMAAFFVWAPHSGRYVVQPGGGIAPLRRDEQGEAIVRHSARNAFVACVLTLGAVGAYAALAGSALLDAGLLLLPLGAAALAYVATDLWLRRTTHE